MARIGPRQWGAAGIAASTVAAVRARQRIGFAPGAATACAFLAPVSLAAGFRRSRARDVVVWAAQMWAYKNAFELPNDDEQRLVRRAHLDYPIVVASRLGDGMPPGQRLQRTLRRRGHLTVLDKALSFLYWTWEAAMLLAEQDPRLGALGSCYALALGFGLVYLAEHYLGDLLAGRPDARRRGQPSPGMV